MILNGNDVVTSDTLPPSQNILETLVTDMVTAYDKTIVQNNMTVPLLILLAAIFLSRSK
jgi:hypothetical protein